MQQRISNQALYIFLIALGILGIYYLAPILTPFLLGALLAYLLNPLVLRLEKRHVPHLLSVTIVFLLLIVAMLLLILALIPLIQTQLAALIEALPKMIGWLQDTILPKLKKIVNLDTLKSQLQISGALPKAAAVMTTVLESGHAIILWIVNLILTVVVTFYLLRDWDKLVVKLKQALPKSIRSTILELSDQFDEVLSAFFRGQFLVMLGLAIIYSIGLSVIGLQVGLAIGILGGILSIVPYLGSAFVLVTASIAAIVQFGSWHSVGLVFIVFLIGQGIEGYILTPTLIGDRLGLHPVAIIFAVLAGGTLFGFFGVLLALPVTALIKVLFNYIRHKYANAN